MINSARLTFSFGVQPLQAARHVIGVILPITILKYNVLATTHYTIAQ